MLNISKKLLSTLVGFGVSDDLAAKIASSFEGLGDSSESSFERDNYEITVAAKALSSLIDRHNKKTTPADEFNEDKKSAEEYEVHKLDVSENRESKSKEIKVRKESKFWANLEKCPKGLRVILSYLLPFLIFVGMVLLTCVTVAVVTACIAIMLAITVAGIVLFIAGLLYGISQLNVFPAAAYYEIGVGLIIGGVSALLTVLFYNVVTRLLPFALKSGIKMLNKLMIRFRRFRCEMRDRV